MTTEKFRVTGMTCAACQANVTRRVQKLSGVQEVDVSLLKNQMQVTFDESAVAEGDICAAVTEIGYGAEPAEAPAPPGGDGSGRDFQSQWKKRQQDAEEEQAAMKKRLTLSIILLVSLMYVAMGAMMGLPVPSFLIGMENALVSAMTQLLITLPILVLNRKFYTGGLRSLWKRSPNMSLLYGIFALYRMAWGFGHGDMALVHQYAHDLYFESSAMIVTLVTVGKYLESRSKAKTSGALDKLVDLAPKTATVLREGAETVIPAQQVQAGDIVVIRPGESLPVDGVVTEGHGYVDQSAITGESLPVERGPGDPVLSATINKNGSFQFRASKVGDDTTLAQIIRLVDEAGSTKAPIARLADKISGVFVPIVMVIALVTAIVWLIAGQTFEFSLSCAIAVLVISCPCALGLATPVAIMVGTGKAAEYGILVKSAESLENLHRVDTIVLDKTGTLTSGKPAVTDVQVLDAALSPASFLALAAALETGSEHPLAQAVTEYAKSQGITPYKAEDFSATAGRGVQAKIQGELCLAGNLAFLREQGIEADSAAAQGEALARQGKTPLFFVKAGKLAGVIAVADSLRESSLRAVERFHKMGLRVVMLTGDNKATAQAIRQQAGIEEAVSDVLPAEKEAVIRRLQGENRRVAMVGDGINDAPALTRADIGIAIGAGTDIAIDSADVVLMKNSLEDVCTAIELSKSVIRNIRMNLFWAFFYNVLGIPVAAGLLWPLFAIKLSPMLGSAAMSLSSVCVVANALRLRFFKDRARISPQTASPVETPIFNTTVEGANTMKKVLTVEGMMCAHCQSHVQKALEGVVGVTAVNVDLEAKKATVEMAENVADELLTAAVKDAGYEPVDCKAV